ncbi:DoxX family membrane protein, partial [Thiocystis violacea]
MHSTIKKYENFIPSIEERSAKPILTTLVRFTFAASLLIYFWASALTKHGDGPLGLIQPALGAYAQIFPRAMAAAGFDVGALAPWQHAVVIAGTWAEFLLPALLLIGLATRLAALGMIGFVLVQTATDLIGHGALSDPVTLGAWFDRMPDAAILDQRLIWVTLLAVPALLG